MFVYFLCYVFWSLTNFRKQRRLYIPFEQLLLLLPLQFFILCFFYITWKGKEIAGFIWLFRGWSFLRYEYLLGDFVMRSWCFKQHWFYTQIISKFCCRRAWGSLKHHLLFDTNICVDNYFPWLSHHVIYQHLTRFLRSWDRQLHFLQHLWHPMCRFLQHLWHQGLQFLQHLWHQGLELLQHLWHQTCGFDTNLCYKGYLIIGLTLNGCLLWKV
jgi:hypothetical protein